MKRIMAIFVTLVMSMQFTAFAADNDTAVSDSSYQNRMAMLSALNIIDNSTVSANDTISRAQFIKTILIFSNNEPAGGSATGTKFGDVDKDYAYADYVEKGAELGYMTGYSDNAFYPESPVTYSQAVKVMVGMLGYGINAENAGGYPKGYTAQASKLGLVDGVKLSEDNLTMETFVTMLYNACEIPVMEYDISNKVYKAGENDNDTALYYFHKIAKIRGVVAANDITGLYDTADVQLEGQVLIDGECMDVGITNAKDMLGYSVTAYVYYQDESETGEIKYVSADSMNKTLTVDARDILSEDKAFSGTNFVYENENSAKRSIRIRPETAIIFNGHAKPLYSLSDLAVKLGDVTFIDNDGNGTYDCVNIFSATKVIIPEYIAENDDEVTLIDFFNSSNKYTYKKDYKYYDVKIDGERVSCGNLKTQMIVFIGESNAGTGEHSVTRAYLKDTKIAGKVNTKSDVSLEINGTEYEYSPLFDDSKIRINSIGYFWVYDGVLFGYQKSDVEIDGEVVYADKYDYGYMISAVYSGEADPEPLLMLKILTSYNEIEKLKVTDKTKYNGKREKDRHEAAKLFAKSWSGDVFVFNPQIVKYKLDENNDIIEIFTTAYPEGLKYEGSVNTDFKDSNNKTVIRVEKDGVVSLVDKTNIAQYGFYVDTWLNFFYQDENTVVFHINDSNLEDSYASGKFPSASAPNEGHFVHEFYNVDENKNTVAAVVWHTSLASDREQVERGAKPVVVKKVVEVLNSENEVVKAIDGVVDGASVTIPYNDKMTETVKQVFNSIRPGDIIFYSANVKGIVTSLEKSFDSRRRGEYGMSNNAQFDAVHDGWTPAVHLSRKVGYFKIEEKLHNNFFSYRNGEGALCVQLADPSAKVFKMTQRGSKVFVEEITYNEVISGDEVFSMYEYNKLQYMIVIGEE
ncbi:MAG: S-layer homology domain-containing protein [Clostridia bacterium]|nr:S-layer homology domain-containing protein [Clostridia bacterium]